MVPQSVRPVPVAREAGRPQPLREGVYLSTADGDHTLFAERVLIGRGAHCRVIVLDPLVSREHAVLLITPTSVTVEDLQSANGVYVNNTRIDAPQPLHDGDRLLVGTHEMAVFALSPRPRTTTPPPPERPVLSDPPPSAKPGVATERADAIVILGRLADRMIEQGFPREAERVLKDHLERLLGGVHSGQSLAPATRAAAARYALLLAIHLHEGAWVDYVIELHRQSATLLALELVPTLATALGACDDFDRQRLARYIEWVRAAAPSHGFEALYLFDALEALRSS